MRCLAAFALLAASLAFGAPKASDVAREADRFYKDGRFAEAAQRLTEAYRLDPNPLYLYNIARAWEQADDRAAALASYEKYVGLPPSKTRTELVSRARAAIDRLKGELQAEEAKAAQAAAERAKAEAATAQQRLADEDAAARAKADAETEAANAARAAERAEAERVAATARADTSRRKLLAFVAGGAGLVLLGIATGTGTAAASTKHSFLSASTLEDKLGFEQETRTLAAVTDVALVLGLAAVVTGAILFPKEELGFGRVSVALVPLGRGGAFASLGVQW